MTAVALAGWLCAVLGVAACTICASRLRDQSLRVARAAHELRGGLSVAQLALDAAATDAAALQLARAGSALAELDRAAAAREELLDLGALLRDVGAAWRAVRVVVPAGLVVRGERAALAQATSNLVANALEHGAPPVVVRARRCGRVARVEVSDQGSGIPAPIEALVRAGRRGRGRRGHGLAVCAEVARRHGGRLGSAPSGEGSMVLFEVPLDPGEAA
jgi:signal transduction histidine kinase